MSIRSELRSRVAALVLGPRTLSLRRKVAELRRRLAGRPHTLEIFLELDDPYSYLLSLYLNDVAKAYVVELELRLTQTQRGVDRPHADLIAAYAATDCARLSRELDVPFLDKGPTPPVEHRRALIAGIAAVEGQESHVDELLQALSVYWRGDAEGALRRVGATATRRGEEMLERNQQKLEMLGHYSSATICYEGEWYVGVDRLHYLTQRLDRLGARREGAATARLDSIRQVMQLRLPVVPPGAAAQLPPLELFFSFRSPYSYLCFRRAFAIADAFGLQLLLRPVLPMIMRGFPLPGVKLHYIVRDAAREAARLRIPFGRVADPLGRGVERCIAVLAYAQTEKRARDFLINAGEAIWARGIDVATDAGMRKVTSRTGLFWPDVKAAIDDTEWRATVTANRAALTACGAWGVPTLRIGDFVVWGQDRDWLLARHIEELCDSGDGILI